MSNNIQATITGQIPPCLQQKIDKHGKQGKSRKVMKNDEYALDK
jgi:hypothetical protein